MKYRVTLNQRVYEVEVEQGQAILAKEYDAAAPAAPVSAPAPAAPAPAPAAAPAPASAALVSGEAVASPLPGTVLRILVSQDQAVKQGQVLLILEAMKMENEVVAPRDGSVAQIAVQTGAQVETGAPLVILR